jgi:hypothetical protein
MSPASTYTVLRVAALSDFPWYETMLDPSLDQLQQSPAVAT